KKQPAKTADKDVTASAEPDKILYDRALADIKHGRYTEGRLSLQTLINTYPDSEYLAKAKLAVADSYFKEGGTSNLTQSVAEYKDFITFFPFLEEAAYAQMQVGMAHYKMMEKSDRDSSQAQMAEDEFQAMLLKFPQSPLAPQAEQRLREVQEVLADGEYKIAHYYYAKQDYRASAARLLEVTNRYPLYSQSDEALWMLGDIYGHVKQTSKNEDVRNYWGALSGKVYDRIVEQYPLSPRAQDAKSRLKQMGLPVPPANPDALARMQKEREYERLHHQNAVLKGPKGMLHGAPDVSVAAHVGQPNLNPPDDALAASEVLKPNSGGASGFSISGSQASGGEDSSGVGTSNAPTTQEDAASTGVVETGAAAGTTLGVQIIQPRNASTSATTESGAAPANPPAGGASEQPNPPAGSSQPAASQPDAPAAAGGSTSGSTSGSTTPALQTGSDSQSSSSSQTAGQTDQSSTDSTSSTNNQAASPSQTPVDDSKDSSSKKKKGIRKLVPW
ncbi:MAG: outer membrane protein assembly factor BamD, partial [Candidatus Acidiferrales bacterium]